MARIARHQDGGGLMDALRTVGLFAVTAVAEILGCYLP